MFVNKVNKLFKNILKLFNNLSEAQIVALKIGALYLISSFTFLGIVFYGYFAKEREIVLENQHIESRENFHTLFLEIYRLFDDNGIKEAMKKAAQTTNNKFAIFHQNGSILFNGSDFSEEDLREIWAKYSAGAGFYLDKKEHSRVFGFNGEQLLISPHFGRFERFLKNQFGLENSPLILAQIPLVEQNVHGIFVRVLLLFLLSLGVVFAIAFALIRLSLLPLDRKIKELDSFIKDSTHEINTPISVILMSVERLGAADLEPKDRAKLAKITAAAKSLSGIYNDLSYLCFESHTKPQKMDFAALVRQRVENFSEFFSQKGVELKAQIAPATIFAERGKMERVVDNLLSNALKYTERGGSVSVILAKNSLSVADNGVGIEPRDLERIFTRYYRGAQNSGAGGFGVGLALCKKICDFYGIKIKVKSELGVGSEFRLEF